MSTLANPCTEALAAWVLPDSEPHVPVAVAFSGGADSTALLLAAHAQWPKSVVALHVNHGLQDAADGFESHVRARCRDWGIDCHVLRIRAHHALGQSPEAAAREGRYQALAQMAQEVGASEVLLGHHADDQVETLMLALSRGAGVPGLSAMPDRFVRHGVRFARPLLSVDPLIIRSFLHSQGVGVVEDPSNTDLRFTRNRIRHGLLRAWRADFPAYQATVARSAQHAAQAQTLLNDLAKMDLQSLGLPPSIEGLQALSSERQANALRYWLRKNHSDTPSHAQLMALLSQIAACQTRGHSIDLKVGQGMVVRQGRHLHYVSPL